MIGQIKAFAGNTAPSGHLLCDGSTVDVADYPDLFNVIGYNYGGAGTTFDLPDGRQRAVVGAGSYPGLTSRSRGDEAGLESVTLTTSQMPQHSHVAGGGGAGSGGLQEGATGGSVQTQPAGGSQAHENMPPFFVANWIIQFAE